MRIRTGFGRSAFLAAALLAVAAASWAASGTSATAQETARPETGLLNDRAFVPELDGICGLGEDRQRGCDAIRARESVDAATTPWSAIGRLNFAGLRTRQHCTGTLVAESIVLTAAHCLYDRQRKAWIPPESLRFVAGYQRGDAVARAKGRRYVHDPVHDTGSRDFRGGIAQDWALLELDAPIGRQAGVLPLLGPGDGSAEGADVTLAGYAGLRPHLLTLAHDCGPWRRDASGVVLGSCSAMTGDSGAPVLVEMEGRTFVVGVHVAILRDSAGRLLSASVPARLFGQALPR